MARIEKSLVTRALRALDWIPLNWDEDGYDGSHWRSTSPEARLPTIRNTTAASHHFWRRMRWRHWFRQSWIPSAGKLLAGVVVLCSGVGYLLHEYRTEREKWEEGVTALSADSEAVRQLRGVYTTARASLVSVDSARIARGKFIGNTPPDPRSGFYARLANGARDDSARLALKLGVLGSPAFRSSAGIELIMLSEEAKYWDACARKCAPDNAPHLQMRSMEYQSALAGEDSALEFLVNERVGRLAIRTSRETGNKIWTDWYWRLLIICVSAAILLLVVCALKAFVDLAEMEAKYKALTATPPPTSSAEPAPAPTQPVAATALVKRLGQRQRNSNDS